MTGYRTAALLAAVCLAGVSLTACQGGIANPSFYGSALPTAGYTITENTNATGADINGTAIEFTGHGYKGTIGAVSGSSGTVVGITLTPQ
jgi:hypothetical protein